MAMIKCPECGYNISDKADKCPYCGYSFREAGSDSKYTLHVESSFGFNFIAILLIIIAGFILYFGVSLSYKAANVVEQISLYATETSFSYDVFLASLIPYLVYSCVLVGLAAILRQMTKTSDLIESISLYREESQRFQWRCSKCGCINDSTVNHCQACGKARYHNEQGTNQTNSRK